MMFSRSVLRTLAWILAFAVFAGLWGRVLAVQGPQNAGCDVVEVCCDEDHDDGESEAPDDRHGPECPPEPHDHHHHHQHHHGPGCGIGALGFEDHSIRPLIAPAGQRLGLGTVRQLPPESPVIGMEKPPLI